MNPGTVDIPELKGLFYGHPETEVIHEQQAVGGYPGRVQTSVKMFGEVRSARLLDRLISRDRVEGFIDDQPFEFFAVRVELESVNGLGIRDILCRRMTVRMWANPRQPKLHPVVVLRRARSQA